MKTAFEVEQMMVNKQKDISDLQVKAQKHFHMSDESMFNHYDREYAKAVAQYNILLEVLS